MGFEHSLQQQTPVSRSHAVDLTNAFKYAPPLDQTVYAAHYVTQKTRTPTPKRDSSDVASVSSFGSTVGLLKNKLKKPGSKSAKSAESAESAAAGASSGRQSTEAELRAQALKSQIRFGV